MTKVPYKLFVELMHDDSGLEFGKAVAYFSYYIMEDAHCCGSDKQELILDDENKKICKGFFDVVMSAAILKHGTIPKEKVPREFPQVSNAIMAPAVFDPNAVVLPALKQAMMAVPPAQEEPSMWGKITDFIMGR